MNLLATTLEALARHDLPSAVIGAVAMAAHGVARATMDIDLLLVGREALDSPAWPELRQTGIDVAIRRGTADDPLLGVVRLRTVDAAQLDVVVGGALWQRNVIDRAAPAKLFDCVARVASASDLVLLKLYAGSPQDRSDILRLLGASSDTSLSERVDSELPHLPRRCRELWASIRRDLD